MARAGTAAAEIDYVIVSASTGDSPQPPTASIVQTRSTTVIAAITFLSSTPNNLTALFAMNISGGTARQVTPILCGIALKHDWAPDAA